MKSWLCLVVSIFIFVNTQNVTEDSTLEIPDNLEELEKPTIENGILSLTNYSFHYGIENNEILCVLFYSPSYPQSIDLLPEFEKAAEDLSKMKITLGKIDGTEYSKLSEEYNIDFFPSFKLFINGTEEYVDFVGTDKGSIEIYFTKKFQGPYKEISSDEYLKSELSKHNITVVYFGNNEEELNLFKEQAKRDFSLPYIIFQNTEEYNKYNITAKNEGTIVLFKHFDEGMDELTGNLTIEKINDFIEIFSSPVLLPLEEKAMTLMLQYLRPGIILFKPAKNFDQKIENDFYKVAKDNRETLIAVTTLIFSNIQSRFADFLKVDPNQLPCIRIVDPAKQRKYPLNGKLNYETITDFVKKWKSGEVKPLLSSQPVPVQNGTIYKLVGTTFTEKVVNTDKDVIVFFGAKLSERSKKLRVIYEEFAEKYKNQKNLLIAEMDGVENEVEEIVLADFPTIKIWPKGKKQNPIEFEKDVTVKNLEQFIQQYAKNRLIDDDHKNEDL